MPPKRHPDHRLRYRGGRSYLAPGESIRADTPFRAMTSTPDPRVIVPEGGGLMHVSGEGLHPLAPYLPRLTIDWVTTRRETRYREIEGTLAFVDISGFTKLSEGLAKHGKVGAEELTATIDTCFVTLLDLAVAFGGRLLKFGGDALLLHFSGEAHEARACRAAIEMRRALRVVGRLTVLGQRVSLRMSVGVNSGLFHFFLVGDSHRELVVTGPAASTVVAMENTAVAGEIMISASTARALPPSVVGEKKGPGFLLRRAPRVPDDPFVPFEPVRRDVDLSIAIPVGLREAVSSTHQDSEHRRVALAFLHFDGTDGLIEKYGPDETANRLEALVAEVQRATDRHQVTFLATDVDRDGGKIILTAGVPATTGDDEHRMLLAVRDVMDADVPLPIRIGVNRGSVFAGEVGPSYRRTFTVMGDAVNLAARLMAKAEPNQIITSPEVLARSRTGFESEELEPFYVKGKAKPVRALSLGARTGARSVGLTEEYPFVGRQVEQRLLEQCIEDARQGRGRLIEIVGQPGVGKSRLAEQCRSMAGDMMQLNAICEAYDSSTAYHVVQGLLRRLLELPVEGNDEELSRRFLDILAERAPSLIPWAPLIASAIDLSVPETAETRELEEEFRRPRLAEVVIELLGDLLPESGLLTIEDVHFMDEASADLFGYLSIALQETSWLWCVTRRDEDSGFVAPLEVAARIDLPPLDEAAATELAQIVTEDAPIPPHELVALVERSGGNPLFLRELLAAATSGDSVEALPDSIEEVIAARIDRLPSEDRYLLRRLSVLGRSFSLDLLNQVIDDLPDPSDSTWERMEEFVQREVAGQMSFRNGLFRDCAYDGLSFRHRRELHSRAGDSILEMATTKGEDQSERLSFHYLHAQRHQEAWSYSLAAADRAKAVYANVDAAEFYERALLAGRRLSHIESAELSGVHEALGDARNRAGAYGEAAVAYRTARRLVTEDPVSEARIVLKLARVQGWLDRYANALRWISKGLRILEGENGGEARLRRAELQGWYGRFCQEEGHHARAIKWCTQAVEQAESARSGGKASKEVLADALRVIDWAKMDLGLLEEPLNWERALALFEEIDDLSGAASVLNMLGGFAYFRGDWDEALALYRRAQVTDRRTGNAVNDAFYILNIGEIALDQGHLDEAEQDFETASRAWRAAGYRSGAADVKGKLARVATARGLYEQALKLFDECIQELREVGSHGDILEAQARRTECLLYSGDLEGALSAADESLALARSLGGTPPQVAILQRVRGAALARRGDLTGAGEALEQSLQAARLRRAEYEAALTMRVMARSRAESDPDRRADLEGEASAMLSKLGVVWTPDPLASANSNHQDTATTEESSGTVRDTVAHP